MVKKIFIIIVIIIIIIIIINNSIIIMLTRQLLLLLLWLQTSADMQSALQPWGINNNPAIGTEKAEAPYNITVPSLPALLVWPN